jgi:hypothetical protein
MPVETAADQIAILADFGESAQYTPVGGALTTITGIFDNAYEAVDAGGTVPIAITQPHFVCRTSDVPNAADGDALVVRSINYIVRVVMSDGTGITDLMLERQ